MENIFGIKISRIAFPDERLSYDEWARELNVSRQYLNTIDDNAIFLNKQYDFSKLKQNKNESTDRSA